MIQSTSVKRLLCIVLLIKELCSFFLLIKELCSYEYLSSVCNMYLTEISLFNFSPSLFLLRLPSQFNISSWTSGVPERFGEAGCLAPTRWRGSKPLSEGNDHDDDDVDVNDNAGYLSTYNVHFTDYHCLSIDFVTMDIVAPEGIPPRILKITRGGSIYDQLIFYRLHGLFPWI